MTEERTQRLQCPHCKRPLPTSVTMRRSYNGSGIMRIEQRPCMCAGAERARENDTLRAKARRRLGFRLMFVGCAAGLFAVIGNSTALTAISAAVWVAGLWIAAQSPAPAQPSSQRPRPIPSATHLPPAPWRPRA